MSQPDRNDLPNLRLFLAIVKRCSFSAAAIEFGLSPSAASHAVRRLEERLGVKLLNRTSRTVIPTELGRDLASKLTHGFDAIDTALQAFNSREGVSLGVSVHCSCRHGPSPICAFIECAE
jgi:DNA-binding transcriptional LysR family regulator